MNLTEYLRKNTLLGNYFDYEVLLENDCIGGFKIMFVTFRKEFGPWQVGQRCDILSVDFDAGVMIEYDLSGIREVKRTRFGIVAMEAG